MLVVGGGWWLRPFSLAPWYAFHFVLTERQNTRSMEAHSPKRQEDPTTHHQHKKKDRSTKQERQGQSGRQTRRREGKDKEEGIPRGREE